MRLRDQVALTLPTLLLRLTLGLVFLWAGTGKLLGTISVAGDDAARLANIGIMPIAPVAPNDGPNDVLDDPEPSDEEEPAEEMVQPDEVPIETYFDNKREEDKAARLRLEILDAQRAEKLHAVQEQLLKELHEQNQRLNPDPPAEPELENDDQQVSLQSVQYSDKVYAGSDFPEFGEIKQVYAISLMITKAANPGLTEDSQPIDSTIPEMFGRGIWPKALAWAVAVTEIAAGVFLVLGFMTRLSAFSLLSVMVTAIWMTQVGPAMMQSSDAILGFIPRVNQPWSPGAYKDVFFQLSLGAMAASVMMMGSGAIGIDRLLFRPRVRDPYVHGDPKAEKPKRSKKAAPEASRGEFDRTPNHTP